MAEQKNIQSGSAETEVESSGFFARFFSGDKPLWAIIILLAIFSLLVVYSSTASMAYKNAGGNTAHYFFNQLCLALRSCGEFIRSITSGWCHFINCCFGSHWSAWP